MLLRIAELLDEDVPLLMAVYQESNKENRACFFPEIEDLEQGLRMTEEAYTQWMRDDFLKKDHTACYVWEEKGVWVSCLRFHEIDDKQYFIEALETHPEYRKQGYAEKLIKSIIEQLKGEGAFKIYSYTSIKNVASQKTHLKCGFIEIDEKPFDYIDQKYVSHAVGFLYDYSTYK